MNTNTTYTTEQIEYAEKMFARTFREGDNAETLMDSCLRLAEMTVGTTEGPETNLSLIHI